jgi:hypothetical protein
MLKITKKWINSLHESFHDIKFGSLYRWVTTDSDVKVFGRHQKLVVVPITDRLYTNDIFVILEIVRNSYCYNSFFDIKILTKNGIVGYVNVLGLEEFPAVPYSE